MQEGAEVALSLNSKHWAEDALAASEFRYRTLVELSPDAIYINRGGRITFLNAAALRLFGASCPEQLLGSLSIDLYPPEERHRILERRRALERGEVVPLAEHKVRRLDGGLVDVAVTAAPFADDQGPAIQVILRDISERKKNEAALREQELMSRTVLATAMDGFWMVSLDGKLVDVNEAYCRMSGYSRDELLSMHISNLEITEPSSEAVCEHMRRVVQSGSDRFETRHRCKDGRIIDVEVSVNYLALGPGYAFAFLHDISQRKQIEARLAMLAHAVESTSEPICITDLEDRFIFVNRAFQQTYGYTDTEILGKTPGMLASLRNPPCLLATILEQTRLGGWRGEILDVNKDGREFPVSLNSSKIQDSTGRVIGLIGVAQDITERKRAESALRESERHYRLLFETMVQGVVYQDREGRIVAMNPAAERILGKGPREFLGQTSADTELHTIREDGSVFPGAQHPTMVALRTGQNASAVMGVFNPKEQAYRWIMISAVPLFNPGESKPFQVYALFDDITERKRVHDELQKAHNRIWTVLESIADGFNSFDHEWHYTYVNSMAARVMGKRPSELLGKKIWDVWPKADTLPFGSEFRRAVREKTPSYFEAFYPEPLNRWLDVRCYPSSEGLSVFFTDVTARKQAAIELDTLRQKLSRVDRIYLLGELTATLTHELNQPLTAILINAQAAIRLLKDRKAGVRQIRDVLGDIIKDNKRAAGVIRNLRSLLSNSPTEFSPVDANAIVRDTVRLIQGEVLMQNTALLLDLEPALPFVRGNGIQLQQVLLNLLSNAMDSLKSQPGDSRQLTICTKKTNENVVTVRVSDTGAGIPEEHQKSLFESFFTTKTGGMGMGLRICRSIVQAHGGTIWAANNSDRGSTFTFTLHANASKISTY